MAGLKGGTAQLLLERWQSTRARGGAWDHVTRAPNPAPAPCHLRPASVPPPAAAPPPACAAAAAPATCATTAQSAAARTGGSTGPSAGACRCSGRRWQRKSMRLRRLLRSHVCSALMIRFFVMFALFAKCQTVTACSARCLDTGCRCAPRQLSACMAAASTPNWMRGSPAGTQCCREPPCCPAGRVHSKLLGRPERGAAANRAALGGLA